jgi:hypothetical protein
VSTVVNAVQIILTVCTVVYVGFGMSLWHSRRKRQRGDMRQLADAIDTVYSDHMDHPMKTPLSRPSLRDKLATAVQRRINLKRSEGMDQPVMDGTVCFRPQ